MLHYIGKPRAKDPASAFMWWTLAASQGDEMAEKNLTLLTEETTTENRAKGLEMASQWVGKFGVPADFNKFTRKFSSPSD